MKKHSSFQLTTANLSLPTPNSRGFTLIELLVAATIAVLLAAIGVVSYQTAMRKSRDGKRKSDLEQIRAALEMYRADNDSYPPAITFGGALTEGDNTYMQQIPQDPKYSYSYRSLSGNNSYVLCAYLESGAGDTSCPNSCGAGACGGQTCNYEVCPP